MYYLGHCDETLELNSEAKRLIDSSNYRLKATSIKKQLIENEAVFKTNFKEIHKKLYSQIHTTDGLFNLPCI